MERSVNNEDVETYKESVLSGNGAAVARILQEVGSCNWEVLQNRAAPIRDEPAIVMKTDLSRNSATATVYKREANGILTDIAIVHDSSCLVKSNKPLLAQFYSQPSYSYKQQHFFLDGHRR